MSGTRLPKWAQLNVRQMPEEGLQIEDELPADLWTGAEEGILLAAPLAVALACVKRGDRVEVEGRLRGAARMECARCLRPVDVPIDAPVHALYMPGDPTEDDVAISSKDEEDVYFGWYEPPDLDLLDEVRQVAVVSLPHRALCSEGCRGLCPSCGADLNEETCSCEAEPGDTRWDKLREFRNKLKE